MLQKMKIKVTAALALALAALAMGCASMTKDTQGRDLVYLQEVKFDVSNPDLGLFVPWFKVPVDAVVKVGVGAFAGTKVASALEAKKEVPEVFITYSKKEGEISLANVGHNFSRPVWEGMPELQTKRWYILAKDDKGKYLIPCDASCQPAAR